MGKRKLRSEEEILRKIRKLQDCLNSMPQEQQSENTSQTQQQPEYHEVEELNISDDNDELDIEYTDVDTPHHSRALSLSPPRAPPLPPQGPTSPPPAPEADPLTLQPKPSTSAEPETTELELEDDVLELLGDAPKTETPLGPPIHKDIASRWQDVLAKGLQRDTRDSLLKAYNIPSNCDLLIAPTLNPEVKAALPEQLVKRDSSLFHKQKQLGVALSALATAVDLIVSKETSKPKILKPISDACRILCDSHSSETKTRRSFIISAINTKLKDTLLETTRNAMLFGDNVTEKVKAAKTIQQSGDALKTQQQKPRAPAVRPNNNNKKGNLNFTGQHRKVDNKLQAGTKRTSWTAHRTTVNSSSRQRRSSPTRNPPPRVPAPPRR